jgi:hypothetical protein
MPKNLQPKPQIKEEEFLFYATLAHHQLVLSHFPLRNEVSSAAWLETMDDVAWWSALQAVSTRTVGSTNQFTGYYSNTG